MAHTTDYLMSDIQKLRSLGFMIGQAAELADSEEHKTGAGWLRSYARHVVDYPDSADRAQGYDYIDKVLLPAFEEHSISPYRAWHAIKLAPGPINVANPHDKDCGTAFLFQFGTVGTLRVLAFDSSLESALETAAGWLSENAPGHLMPYGSDDHRDLIREAIEDSGHTWDEWKALEHSMGDLPRWATDAIESAESDLTYTESGFLTSYEWWVDGPLDRDQIIAMAKELDNR